MSKYPVILLLILILASSASWAMKLENLPFMSDVHTGIVYGPGMGIDLGAGAWLFLRDIKVGVEVEILMTDANYTATLNATRYGGVFGTKFQNYTLNYHVGALNFISNRDLDYNDMSNQPQQIKENINYKGHYWGFSVDIPAGEFILSPKYLINTVTNQGSIWELDLNIARSL
jgi:hypothetical protein